tara:strand:- start:675 stop:1061 length:387 start_codon:yes stop_codon:yes gene_type:complete
MTKEEEESCWDDVTTEASEHTVKHPEKAHPRLEDWSLTRGGNGSAGSIYTAPELRPVALSGTVFNHPVKQDGDEVGTSQLRSLVFENGVGMACTANRVYVLGKMAKDYETFRRGKGLSVLSVSFAASP